MSVTTARPGPARNIIEGNIIGVILTVLSYVVALEAHWIKGMNGHWLEAFAVFTSYVCTYLCVKERRINYPIGAISTAAYAWLFYKQHLLGSALLNAYLTPQLVYGWFRWRRDEVTRPVTKVALKWWPVYVLASVGAFWGAREIMHAMGGSMATLDSIVLVGSILAQWLLDNKKIENWWIWLAVDAVAIVDYAKVGLSLAAFQYVAFLANTFYGLFIWYKSMKEGNSNEASMGSYDRSTAHEGPLALGTVR